MDAKTIAAACDWTERVFENVTEQDYRLPTPCDDWDVHALMNHLLGTLELGVAILHDTESETGMTPGGLPEHDLVGDDAVKAYRAATEAWLAAATPQTLGAVHTSPIGELPGAALVSAFTLDVAVHGWDLARATGQTTDLGDDVAAPLLAFALEGVTDDNRAPLIGPAVVVPSSASITDQLVGYMGRTP